VGYSDLGRGQINLSCTLLDLQVIGHHRSFPRVLLKAPSPQPANNPLRPLKKLMFKTHLPKGTSYLHPARREGLMAKTNAATFFKQLTSRQWQNFQNLCF
jgi:hypothetical protein